MTTIGIVTEGQSEVKSLPCLYPQIRRRVNNVILKPVFAQVDPQAPVPVIVKKLKSRIDLAYATGAERVIVLLDREQSRNPAGCRAEQLQAALRRSVTGDPIVVLKDRNLENWLIACPSSYANQKGRFPNYEIIARRVTVGSADRVDDAKALINEACARKGRYEKMADSVRIMDKAVIEEIAQNSRSFRRLLAALGDDIYRGSSLNYIEREDS